MPLFAAGWESWWDTYFPWLRWLDEQLLEPLAEAGFGLPITAVYFLVLGTLCLLGVHRLFLLHLFNKAQKVPLPKPEIKDDYDWPVVTLQLPLYNERTVVERLLRAVAKLDYPRDRLEVQVNDDSTDETVELVATLVEELRDSGMDIKQVRRPDRVGYKAGALEFGMAEARGEFLAIFDADFVPQPRFLKDTVPYFHDQKIGMVQARWGHLNREFSRLTKTQAVLLDAHFVVEHYARSRSGRFFNFNGTAGIWRKACITDAGGWSHDTLTEDLDLSYRAQLKGWRFVFLPDIVAPAELPADMDAFKTQQYRWTKGSVQVAFKALRPLWSAKHVPFAVKLEASIHLLANYSYLLMVFLAVLLVPAIFMRLTTSWYTLFVDMGFFFFGTLAVSDFFMTGQRAIGMPTGRRFKDLPLCLAMGMGLSLNNARAVISAVFGRESPFVRTPKANIDAQGVTQIKVKRYSPQRSIVPYLEVLFGLGFVLSCVQAVRWLAIPSIPFLALFAAGFLYCGLASLKARYFPGQT